jgi:hypothetical protein
VIEVLTSMISWYSSSLWRLHKGDSGFGFWNVYKQNLVNTLTLKKLY